MFSSILPQVRPWHFDFLHLQWRRSASNSSPSHRHYYRQNFQSFLQTYQPNISLPNISCFGGIYGVKLFNISNLVQFISEYLNFSDTIQLKKVCVDCLYIGCLWQPYVTDTDIFGVWEEKLIIPPTDYFLLMCQCKHLKLRSCNYIIDNKFWTSNFPNVRKLYVELDFQEGAINAANNINIIERLNNQLHSIEINYQTAPGINFKYDISSLFLFNKFKFNKLQQLVLSNDAILRLDEHYDQCWFQYPLKIFNNITVQHLELNCVPVDDTLFENIISRWNKCVQLTLKNVQCHKGMVSIIHKKLKQHDCLNWIQTIHLSTPTDLSLITGTFKWNNIAVTLLNSLKKLKCLVIDKAYYNIENIQFWSFLSETLKFCVSNKDCDIDIKQLKGVGPSTLPNVEEIIKISDMINIGKTKPNWFLLMYITSSIKEISTKNFWMDRWGPIFYFQNNWTDGYLNESNLINIYVNPSQSFKSIIKFSFTIHLFDNYIHNEKQLYNYCKFTRKYPVRVCSFEHFDNNYL